MMTSIISIFQFLAGIFNFLELKIFSLVVIIIHIVVTTALLLTTMSIVAIHTHVQMPQGP